MDIIIYFAIPFSYLLMKSLYYLADLICYKTGLSKSQLGKIVAIFHIWIIGYSYYELYFSSPIENKNYIFYYNFTFWVAFSNFVLNGCVLVKVERYLFENKERTCQISVKLDFEIHFC